MASTPEGKVKERIKKRLVAAGVYFHMPVQNGMGAPALDFVGCRRGAFFAIEAKAPGEEPTPRQLLTISDMERADGKVFVIDGTDYTELDEWLKS